MYIKSIKLKNFRNYNELEAKFNKKVNFFIGQNAQGKTNLLESIYITSVGKSFRTNKDSEIIGFGKQYSSVKAEFIRENDEKDIDIIIENTDGSKVAYIEIKNGNDIFNFHFYSDFKYVYNFYYNVLAPTAL